MKFFKKFTKLFRAKNESIKASGPTRSLDQSGSQSMFGNDKSVSQSGVLGGSFGKTTENGTTKIKKGNGK